MPGPDSRSRSGWVPVVDRVTDYGLRALLGAGRFLPYEKRVGMAGTVMERVIAPLTDIHERVHSNLKLVFPDMEQEERNRILRGCVDNFGRVFAEAYSTVQFVERVACRPPGGPGLQEIEKAKLRGQPVLLVTGHFGNYEAGRVQLIRRGHSVGGVYRAMNNAYFNRHYVRTMERIGRPVFPRGGSGTKGFVKFVKEGGLAVVLNDQYSGEGEELGFMGLPTMTNTGVARLAVRFDALLVPFYGTRRSNGLDFDVEYELPIEHGDVSGMTQALNDSLEARVRANPEQWYWIHRRWKQRLSGNRS